MKRRNSYQGGLGVLAAGSAILLGLAACAPGGGGGTQATSGGGSGDGSITVGVEAGSPWETFYGKVAPDFTKETGIDVKFLPVPHANMHQQFLSDAVSGTGAYDVYTVDQTWMPEFASKGYLAEIDDQLQGDARADFLPHTLDTATYKDKLYSVPFMVHNTVMYYRTDLFKAAGIEHPPTTWQEYRDAAKKLTDSSTGTWGTIIPGKQDGEVATRFESFVQQAGGDIADSNGAPTIDTPEAREALRMMLAIQNEDKSSPNGLHDLTDMQGQFLEGKVAMVPVWPYLDGLASDPAQSKVAGKFSVAPSPGNPDQVSTTFSWGFGVSASSKNADAAKKWVAWSTSSKVLEQLSRAQSVPVPRQSVSDALAKASDLSEAQRHTFSVFNESVAASKTMPMTPAYSQYQDAIAVAVSSVMSGTKDIDSALSTAQTSMENAYESVGK
ncbi:ABC transporter substrate-binding protein [Paenarthrobacter ureafaciens]|uniref:ABC transporter substrate-binding protein n=1 Tax=Paenarthrobacter ureafaciens TaxID=37931 RepID=UPI001C2BD76B|nr:sugar ABC transporter substrate-binding protein [Paenarthrobacter ureafaciens]